MSPEKVAELRELLARATPGPWFQVDDDNEADAALIVAAVNALPELLDALPSAPQQGEKP